MALAPCHTCAGTGEDFQICPRCEGIGFHYEDGRVDQCRLCNGSPTAWVKCPACEGLGSQIAADLFLLGRAVSMPSRRAKEADR